MSDSQVKQISFPNNSTLLLERVDRINLRQGDHLLLIDPFALSLLFENNSHDDETFNSNVRKMYSKFAQISNDEQENWRIGKVTMTIGNEEGSEKEEEQRSTNSSSNIIIRPGKILEKLLKIDQNGDSEKVDDDDDDDDDDGALTKEEEKVLARFQTVFSNISVQMQQTLVQQIKENKKKTKETDDEQEKEEKENEEEQNTIPNRQSSFQIKFLFATVSKRYHHGRFKLTATSYGKSDEKRRQHTKLQLVAGNENNNNVLSVSTGKLAIVPLGDDDDAFLCKLINNFPENALLFKATANDVTITVRQESPYLQGALKLEQQQ